MKQRPSAAEEVNGRLNRLSGLTRFAGLACLIFLLGCRQDMQDQPKFYPQRGSAFYADGRSVQSQIPGTVARSQGVVNDYFHTGLVNGKEGDGLPIALSMDLMRRGQERYNVYCVPCHSRVGNGLGMIVQRGYYPATSFDKERLRQAPLGHFFQVMTNGLGAMPNYSAELAPQDRWAVAAYIRALQLSQNAKETDIENGKKAAKLIDIATLQGYSSDFLDVWISSPKARPPAPPSVQAVATPVKPPAERTSPSVISYEAVLKKLSTSAASAKTSTPSNEPKKATAPVAPAAPKEPVHDISGGQMVYMRNCASCHQISRAGMPPNIPSLVGIVAKVGAERIRAVIGTGIPTGKPPMPAFPNLTSDDIENLIAFLQASK